MYRELATLPLKLLEHSIDLCFVLFEDKSVQATGIILPLFPSQGAASSKPIIALNLHVAGNHFVSFNVCAISDFCLN